MLKTSMAVWTDSEQSLSTHPDFADIPVKQGPSALPKSPGLPAIAKPAIAAAKPVAPAKPLVKEGWLVPSTVSSNPEDARACMLLPEFDELLLEKARVISGRFPHAEAEFRSLRSTFANSDEPELPHFEKVFRIAAAGASIPDVQEAPDYDSLLVLTAWHSVRPGVEGFLGSYPKSLLCPLSHTAPPAALENLTTAKQLIFERRAPFYLRYLLREKFGLRTCADIENADLRELLRSTGFRLIRASAVPEVAFPGITRGEDP